MLYSYTQRTGLDRTIYGYYAGLLHYYTYQLRANIVACVSLCHGKFEVSHKLPVNFFIGLGR